jgi:hypothetical protein
LGVVTFLDVGEGRLHVADVAHAERDLGPVQPFLPTGQRAGNRFLDRLAALVLRIIRQVFRREVNE